MVRAVCAFPLGSPCEERVQSRTQRLAPIRQAIFDFRRHLMVDDTPHNAVLLHLTKLLDQHFLGNRRDCAFEIREAQNMPAKKVKQDHEFPAPLEELEGTLDAFGCRFSRILMRHTFL